MTRHYYSSRKNPGSLSLSGLYRKLQHLYLYFRDQDYFEGEAGITQHGLPESIEHKAALALDFQLFPITAWEDSNITEDHIFDAIEFLYDYVSKPGELVDMVSETGYNYSDYESYDEETGKDEFRQQVNAVLADYKSGFELTEEGIILALGSNGLQDILSAEIVPYDEDNVDSKVRDAIRKWRNRHLDIHERKEAVRELIDVFEWLKKTGALQKVLATKDDRALFEIANKFALRHHDPGQRRDYDENIWYSWMFHFYLATYHAVIRFLRKKDNTSSAN